MLCFLHEFQSKRVVSVMKHQWKDTKGIGQSPLGHSVAKPSSDNMRARRKTLQLRGVPRTVELAVGVSVNISQSVCYTTAQKYSPGRQCSLLYKDDSRALAPVIVCRHALGHKSTKPSLALNVNVFGVTA